MKDKVRLAKPQRRQPRMKRIAPLLGDLPSAPQLRLWVCRQQFAPVRGDWRRNTAAVTPVDFYAMGEALPLGLVGATG